MGGGEDLLLVIFNRWWRNLEIKNFIFTLKMAEMHCLCPFRQN